MKNFACLLFALLVVNSCAVSQQNKNGNPIFSGWYADPEAVIFNQTYWIFPTYSAPFEEQIFMDAFSSKDLKHWKKHSKIIDTTAVKWAKKAMWAPSIIEKDHQYFLFFAANDVHENEIGGIGIGVSNQPQGPYKDYLGKPLIGEIENGAQPIDQFVFKDKDGQFYLYYGGWRHCNVVKLKPDFTGLIPFEDGTVFKEITPEQYTEGPFLFLRNGKYYLMWSEGEWAGPDYSVAYAIADSPLGPFKRMGKILQQNPAIATGAGHHSVIQIPGTEEWYIVYHRRPLEETSMHSREICIDRMYFNEDGTIKPVEITNSGVKSRILPKQN